MYVSSSCLLCQVSVVLEAVSGPIYEHIPLLYTCIFVCGVVVAVSECCGVDVSVVDRPTTS